MLQAAVTLAPSLAYGVPLQVRDRFRCCGTRERFCAQRHLHLDAGGALAEAGTPWRRRLLRCLTTEHGLPPRCPYDHILPQQADISYVRLLRQPPRFGAGARAFV